MQATLTRSSLQTIATMAARVGIQAITLVIVTRALGPSLYGAYVAAASLAMILGLIPNLGAGYVLMAKAARESGAATDTWSYAWPMSLGIGFLFSAIFPWLGRSVSDHVISLLDLAVLGAAELMLTPLILLLSFVLQSVNRVPAAQWLLTIPLLIKLVAASIFASIPAATLTNFVAMQALATSCGLAIALAMTSRVVALRWKPRMPTPRELRLGVNYAAMHVVAANPSELDKITSPLLLGEHAASIYSATSRVMNAVVMPVVGVLLASQPRLFRHAAQPTDEGRRLISILARLSFLWGLISFLVMGLAAPLIPRFFGPAYADAASLMPWVAATAPFLSLRIAAGTILVALGRPLQRLQFELAGVFMLAVSLFVGARVYGSHGMAVALALAEFAMSAYGWRLVSKAKRRLYSRAAALENENVRRASR